ncbi:Ig-like domain-containing protein [Candidatus Peregrinibacteria bacterium]|nr:Ig-like domain-containing protein [Candidatus Peregrinibacteria bacterium]
MIYKRFISIGLIAVIILILGGCGSPDDSGPILYPGAPKVLSIVPETSPKTALILPDQVITIRFDRPMKQTVGDYFKITPSVSGKTQWVSRNTLQFIPEAWPMATSFQIELPAGIISRDGKATEEATSFQLETPEPRVVKVRPVPDKPLSIDAALTVYFNQPMDLGAIQPGNNVQLFPSNDLDSRQRIRKDGFYNVEAVYGKNEAGEDDYSVLVLKPTFPYQKDRSYRLVVKKGLKGVAALPGKEYGMKGLENDFEWKFKTEK